MNWTGGRLQRHSGPAKGQGELTQRQRLHFAKARTQLYHGQQHPPSPFKPDFFASECSNLTGPDSANVSRIQPSTTRQKALDHNATAPTVAHSPRPTKRPTSKNHEASKPRYTVSIDRNGIRYARTRPIERRSRLEIHSQTLQTDHVEVSRVSRCRADGTGNQPELLGSLNVDSASARLKAEKNRILASRDWVGLASSRPLYVAFASGKEKQDIGKRRKVKREQKLRNVENKKYHATIPTRPDTQDNGPYMSGAILAVDDIRIRIGTDALAAQSFVGETDMHEANYSAASLDEMLFDMEAHMAPIRPQGEEFREHDVGSRSSGDEQADMHNTANHCEAEHVHHESIRFNDSHAPLADVDRLLQQLEKSSSHFPMLHESGGVVHTVSNVHASLDELEKDNHAKYSKTHHDNVTMQSPENEALGNYHSAYHTYDQAAIDSITTQSTLSPIPVYIADRSASGELNQEVSKAITKNEGNERLSRSSTLQPLLHETHANEEATDLFDDNAWRKLVGVNSDVTVQSLDMQQADSGNQRARGESSGSRVCNIDKSYHIHSGAVRMDADSAARPIDDSCSMQSGEFEQEHHPTVRNTEATEGTHSSKLHLQMSVAGAAAAATQAGIPAASPCQTDRVDKNVMPRRGMISDAQADASEIIWKRFVFGSDVSQAQNEKCRSPERALRSAAATNEFAKSGISSSFFVQRYIRSVSGTPPLQPLGANSHGTVHQRNKRAKTAAARAMLEDSPDGLPMSMAVEGARKTTADGLSSNDWLDTLDNADDSGTTVSSDLDFQSNVAVASTIGQLPSVDHGHGKEMTFTRLNRF